MLSGSTLVVGATGKQGGAVVDALRRRGHHAIAFVRDAEKAACLRRRGAEIRLGNLTDFGSLQRALRGVSQVFLVTIPSYGFGWDREIEQGVKVIEAARAAGVRQIVFSSVASADRNTSVPHFDTKLLLEGFVRVCGVPTTILRPVFLMENFASTWFLPAIQRGLLALPMRGDRPIQMISVADIGEAAVEAMEQQDGTLNRTIELAGDELTMHDAMESLSRAAGWRIRYEQLPEKAACKVFGSDLTRMFRWLDKTGFGVDLPALRRRKDLILTSFDEALDRAAWVHTVRQAS